MGRFSDAAVVAEAKRRFQEFVATPARVSAAQRHIVLGVVAAKRGRSYVG